MIKQLPEETQAALATLAQSVGGDGSFHIAPVYICDNPDCLNKDAEVFPYHVKDKDGRLWNDLCNACFDTLGCAYPDNLEVFYYDEYEPDCCPFCGKDYEDFSDLGCGHCDRRHPGFIGG